MSSANLDSRINQALDFNAAAADPFSRAKEDLSEIAEALQRKMNDGIAHNPIHIEIEPGFQATMGQQLKVVLRIEAKSFRDSLFRAYVPESGYPMKLDLYGEEPIVCDDRDALEQEILTFLTRVRDRMSSYRDYAR